MCGGERGFPSKLVVTDGCLKEVAAELGFEGWVESGEKGGCHRCMGMRVEGVCVRSEKSNTYSHNLPF